MGNSREYPGWVDILTLAKEWGVPPWVIEDECTPLWWGRWRALREVEAEVREQRRKERADSKAG